MEETKNVLEILDAFKQDYDYCIERLGVTDYWYEHRNEIYAVGLPEVTAYEAHTLYNTYGIVTSMSKYGRIMYSIENLNKFKAKLNIK